MVGYELLQDYKGLSKGAIVKLSLDGKLTNCIPPCYFCDLRPCEDACFSVGEVEGSPEIFRKTRTAINIATKEVFDRHGNLVGIGELKNGVLIVKR